MLEHLLTRLSTAQLVGQIVIATTTDTADDAIVALGDRVGVPVVRGSEHDLLDRHLMAANAHGAEVVVKVPSDCPLIDPAVVDQVIGTFLADQPDYCSNLHPPSWPDGQDVEVISLQALETAHREATAPWEREHTTPFLWERPERFRCTNVAWHRDASTSHRVTVDYPEDLDVVDAVVRSLGPMSTIEEIVDFLDAHPDVAHVNAHLRGVNWYRHHLADLRTVDRDDTRAAPGELVS